jgi:predicted nuclease of predicted toxin-antitoxin system
LRQHDFFLADESVDGQIVYHLREIGYSVRYIAELAPGINDKEVLNRSNVNREILITADKDFGELVFRLKMMPSGIILFRLAGLTSEEKSIILSNSIKKHENKLLNSFTVITPESIRIRNMEITIPDK